MLHIKLLLLFNVKANNKDTKTNIFRVKAHKIVNSDNVNFEGHKMLVMLFLLYCCKNNFDTELDTNLLL